MKNAIEPFALERFFAQYEFRTEFLLCASDCETHSLHELLAYESGAEAAFAALRLGYTEAPGSPELRELIAAQYESIGADDVLVFSGAQEAIFACMLQMLRPGDEAIVHSPAYQSLYAVAQAAGARVVRWMAHEEQRWALDVEFLRETINTATKAIVINSPHNPTGSLLSQDAQQQIIDVAAAHGTMVFSDEVYRLSEYDERERLPAICDRYDRGVSLGVISKSFGLAGLRIGWLATRDREVLRRAAELKDYLTICNSGPSEFLAMLALRNATAILRRNGAITGANLKLLDEVIARHPQRLSWVRPRAAPIGFLRIHDPRGATAFSNALREKTGVLLLPSAIYEAGDSHVRIGFGRANFAEGLERFEAFL